MRYTFGKILYFRYTIQSVVLNLNYLGKNPIRETPTLFIRTAQSGYYWGIITCVIQGVFQTLPKLNTVLRKSPFNWEGGGGGKQIIIIHSRMAFLLSLQHDPSASLQFKVYFFSSICVHFKMFLLSSIKVNGYTHRDLQIRVLTIFFFWLVKNLEHDVPNKPSRYSTTEE